MRREPIHTPDSPSPGQTAAQRTRPRRHQRRTANLSVASAAAVRKGAPRHIERERERPRKGAPRHTAASGRGGRLSPPPPPPARMWHSAAAPGACDGRCLLAALQAFPGREPGLSRPWTGPSQALDRACAVERSTPPCCMNLKGRRGAGPAAMMQNPRGCGCTWLIRWRRYR